jgi:acylphosphatase
VGFRHLVKSVATGFDVTGWVQNLSDGRVELVVEGMRTELEAFRDGILENGARRLVHREEIGWGEATGEPKGFQIVR